MKLLLTFTSLALSLALEGWANPLPMDSDASSSSHRSRLNRLRERRVREQLGSSTSSSSNVGHQDYDQHSHSVFPNYNSLTADVEYAPSPRVPRIRRNRASASSTIEPLDADFQQARFAQMNMDEQADQDQNRRGSRTRRVQRESNRENRLASRFRTNLDEDEHGHIEPSSVAGTYGNTSRNQGPQLRGNDLWFSLSRDAKDRIKGAVAARMPIDNQVLLRLMGRLTTTLSDLLQSRNEGNVDTAVDAMRLDTDFEAVYHPFQMPGGRLIWAELTQPEQRAIRRALRGHFKLTHAVLQRMDQRLTRDIIDQLTSGDEETITSAIDALGLSNEGAEQALIVTSCWDNMNPQQRHDIMDILSEQVVLTPSVQSLIISRLTEPIADQLFTRDYANVTLAIEGLGLDNITAAPGGRQIEETPADLPRWSDLDDDARVVIFEHLQPRFGRNTRLPEIVRTAMSLTGEQIAEILNRRYVLNTLRSFAGPPPYDNYPGSSRGH